MTTTHEYDGVSVAKLYGQKDTGIKCLNCGHDWARHYEDGCWYLVGGLSGEEHCDCTIPLLARIPITLKRPTSLDALRRRIVRVVGAAQADRLIHELGFDDGPPYGREA